MTPSFGIESKSLYRPTFSDIAGGMVFLGGETSPKARRGNLRQVPVSFEKQLKWLLRITHAHCARKGPNSATGTQGDLNVYTASTNSNKRLREDTTRRVHMKGVG